MKPTVLMVCKGLIPLPRQQDFVSLLPREDQAVFSQLPTPQSFQKEHLQFDLLDHIHFSWLTPYMRTLSEGEIKTFLACLTETQAHGLQKALGLGNHLPKLKKLAKSALRKLLVENVLQGKQLVPFAFLPESPLNSLLTLPPTILGKVIRYLGLHDLAHEMRQIIDTKELKRIFQALSKKEGDYLNQLMLHREPLVLERLFLKNWDGSRETLGKLLDQRGAIRLGLVLSNTSESLAWYLTHALDMHIGSHVLKNIKAPTHERAEAILLKQIQALETKLHPGGSE